MSTHQRIIDPSADLASINSAIQYHETRFCQFVSNEVRFLDGVTTNVATFNELDFGKVPNPLTTVLNLADAVPAGQNKVWEGTMVVSNTISAVKACH